MAIIRRRTEQEGERAMLKHREWDPLEMMRGMLSWDPFEQMRRVMAPAELGFAPSFEVKETKDAYWFKADVPGVKEQDLDLSFTENRLTIAGKREESHKEEGDHFYAYERSYGSFSRSFTLPDGVDLDHVNADLKNGELTIRIPKKHETQARKIPLSTVKDTGAAKA